MNENEMKQELMETKSELAKFDPIKAQIQKAKKENANLVFDYEDEQGNKDARSHIFKLRKLKTQISDVHKIVKADALEYCRKVDAYKNELTSEVEEMIDYHYKPIKAIEDRERARLEEIKRKQEEELQAQEAKKQAELEAREKAVREAEEQLRREKETKEAEERAKQETIERAEREKRIAEEARKQAEEDAKRKLEEAEKKRLADIEAEKQRIHAEVQVKELAELRRKEVEAEAERKRIANKKHRDQIEREIKDSLTVILGYEEIKASELLDALKSEKIPHITINY